MLLENNNFSVRTTSNGNVMFTINGKKYLLTAKQNEQLMSSLFRLKVGDNVEILKISREWQDLSIVGEIKINGQVYSIETQKPYVPKINNTSIPQHQAKEITDSLTPEVRLEVLKCAIDYKAKNNSDLSLADIIKLFETYIVKGSM